GFGIRARSVAECILRTRVTRSGRAPYGLSNGRAIPKPRRHLHCIPRHVLELEELGNVTWKRKMGTHPVIRAGHGGFVRSSCDPRECCGNPREDFRKGSGFLPET